MAYSSSHGGVKMNRKGQAFPIFIGVISILIAIFLIPVLNEIVIASTTQTETWSAPIEVLGERVKISDTPQLLPLMDNLSDTKCVGIETISSDVSGNPMNFSFAELSGGNNCQIATIEETEIGANWTIDYQYEQGTWSAMPMSSMDSMIVGFIITIFILAILAMVFAFIKKN